MHAGGVLILRDQRGAAIIVPSASARWRRSGLTDGVPERSRILQLFQGSLASGHGSPYWWVSRSSGFIPRSCTA